MQGSSLKFNFGNIFKIKCILIKKLEASEESVAGIFIPDIL